MEQKIIYRELLGEIKKLADDHDGRLTRAEVDAFFAHTGLEKEHIDMICEYLISQRIDVIGYTETEKGQAMFADVSDEEVYDQDNNADKDAASVYQDTGLENGKDTKHNGKDQVLAENEEEEEGEHSLLKLYLDELNDLDKPDAKHELELFEALVKRNTQSEAAREQLITAYLPMICELAAEYEGGDILAEDLIQEGNIGLIMALDGMEKMDSLAAYQVTLMNKVNQWMEDAIGTQKGARDMDKATARKVNRLNEAIQSLTEELEHTVSIGELSVYLDMPEWEIRDILKLAGDEIKIDERW